jgi:hypothetical protein
VCAYVNVLLECLFRGVWFCVGFVDFDLFGLRGVSWLMGREGVADGC